VLQAQATKHEKSVLEYQNQESDFQAEIDDLEERLSEAENKVTETKEQREVLQSQYIELVQSLASTQQELAANKLLLTQNLQAHREKERSIMEELDRRQREINDANMRVATTESSMDVLRQQLASVQSRLAQSQSMPPPTIQLLGFFSRTTSYTNGATTRAG